MTEKVAQAFVEDPRNWIRILASYRETNVSRSIFELLVTAAPFVMFWALMWASLAIGYWLCLLLAVRPPPFSCACS